MKKDEISEMDEIIDACEYWSHQKIQSQRMLELCDANLIRLQNRLKEINPEIAERKKS